MTEQKKRGPGRPPNTEKQAVAEEVIARSPERAPEARNTQRPPRVPIGQGQKLVAPERKGYQRYWALDREGQLDQMIAAWWDYVVDSEGNKITRPGGGGATHYLMEIPDDLYAEDMKTQQDMVTDALRQTTKVGADEYVPNGKEDVLTRDKI